MPTFARIALSFDVGAGITSFPITIRPPLIGSSALMHLTRVDLPEPEGPHTTTTSPAFTWVVQPYRTWVAPYHLDTFSILIML